MKSKLMQLFVVFFVWINVAIFVNADENPIDGYRRSIDVTKEGRAFPFFELIRDGKTEDVKNLLSTVTQDDKNNGVVIAAQAGRDEIATLLIENHASVGYKRNHVSPMKAGILWAAECYKNSKSFCKSVTANNVIKVLIKAEANVNEKLDSNDFTLLHLATQLGVADTIELLIKAKADLYATDINGWNALHRCVYSHDKIEVIDLLLQYGADIDEATTDHKATALHIATSMLHEQSVRLLLKRGANRKLKNEDGKTALKIAKDIKSNSQSRQRIINYLEKCYFEV